MTDQILVVDNYDSFAYNLVQFVGEALTDGIDPSLRPADPWAAVVVRRNDEIDPAWIRELDPAGIVVSPGPGTPADAGVSEAVFGLEYPTLGVCLGHQALCSSHGAPVAHAPEVVHGKPSTVTHDGRGLFDDIADPIEAGRYHSLAIEREQLPDVLEETAWTADDRQVLMGVRHREHPYIGVQFHPESILTDDGKRLVATFCERSLGGEWA